MSNQAVSEQELAAKATGPRVSLEDRDNNIAGYGVFNVHKALTALGIPALPSTQLLTIAVVTTHNGFTVVGESACAWPANYDEDMGNRLALENAKNKLWPLMGYALKQGLWDANMIDGPTQLQHPQQTAGEEATKPEADGTTEASVASEGTWQERLKAEEAELFEKLSMLSKYLGTEAFKLLSDRNQRYLIEQKEAMFNYHTILQARLLENDIK